LLKTKKGEYRNTIQEESAAAAASSSSTAILINKPTISISLQSMYASPKKNVSFR
jgi:hypothetical protein